jgi:hypothetical protein
MLTDLNYYVDLAKGEYGLAAVWRTRETAHAAAKANEPEIMGENLKGSLRFIFLRCTILREGRDYALFHTIYTLLVLSR